MVGSIGQLRKLHKTKYKQTYRSLRKNTSKFGELWKELCFVLFIILKLFGSLIYIYIYYNFE
jgi:hypothetical protein